MIRITAGEGIAVASLIGAALIAFFVTTTKPPTPPSSLSMLCVETDVGEFIDISLREHGNRPRCIRDLPPGKYLIEVAAITDFCMDPIRPRVEE